VSGVSGAQKVGAIGKSLYLKLTMGTPLEKAATEDWIELRELLIEFYNADCITKDVLAYASRMYTRIYKKIPCPKAFYHEKDAIVFNWEKDNSKLYLTVGVGLASIVYYQSGNWKVIEEYNFEGLL